MIKTKTSFGLFCTISSIAVLLSGCTLSNEAQPPPAAQAQATYQIISTAANKDTDIQDIKPILDYRARVSGMKNVTSETIDNKLVLKADFNEFTFDAASKLTEINQLSIGEKRKSFTTEELARKKNYNEEQKTIIDRAYLEAQGDSTNFDAIVTTYSENTNLTNKAIHNYQRKDGIQKEIADTLFDTGTGALTKLITTPDMVWFAKVLDRKEQEEITAQHILISYIGSKAKNPYLFRTKSQAEKLVNEIKDTITPKNFSGKAKEFSDDGSNSGKGGSLGAFPRGAMSKPFEDAAFSAELNTVVGPIETEFGWHFILVTKKETIPFVQYQDVVRFFKGLTPVTGYVPVIHIGNEIRDIQPQVKTEKNADTKEETKNYRLVITFNNEGKQMLIDFAKTHNNLENLALMLDDAPYWKLTADDQITSDGSIVLQGSLTEEQVRKFNTEMKSYSLPTGIQLVDYQMVTIPSSS